MSNSAQTASRSRLARRPPSPARAACRRSRSGQPVPDQSNHNASSAVAPRPIALRQRASNAATRRAPSTSVAAGSSSSRSGDRSAAAISSADGRGSAVPASSARSACRRARPSRRRAMLSSPAEREIEQHLRLVRIGSAVAERDLQAEQQRPDGRLGGQRDLVAGHLDRDPAAASARLRPGIIRFPERTSTAISLPRHAVAQVGLAQQLGDVLGLGARRRAGEGLDPAARQTGCGYRVPERGPYVRGQGARQRQSAGDVPARGEQGGAEPAGGAQGDDRCRGAGRGPEVGREVEDAAGLGAPEGVDRLVGVPDHDHVPPVAGDGLQQPHLGGIGVLVLVDEDRRHLAPQSVDDRRVGEQDPAAVHQLGVVQHLLGVEHVEVLVEELPDRLPTPVARRARRRSTTSSGSMPSWRALASTARTSPANARVPNAGARLSGQPTRCRPRPDCPPAAPGAGTPARAPVSSRIGAACRPGPRRSTNGPRTAGPARSRTRGRS